MTHEKTERVYDLWSRVYDLTFGTVTRKRQHHALGHLAVQSGDWVLDLGVGTGLTMALFPADVHVVGLDRSSGMLLKAASRCRTLQLGHCHLIQADAMRPPFADASFDRILISHTISVVSNPQSVMRWATRLVKPGGRVVVLNHFQSAHRLLAAVERALNPMCMLAGWRSDLTLEAMLAGTDLQLEYCFQLRTADMWKVVVLRRPPGRRRTARRPVAQDAASRLPAATPAIVG